jgi:Fe-S cluster assembly protein SufD
MDTFTPDVLAARRRLQDHGWIARNAESFRHLPPPAAVSWLGDDCRPIEFAADSTAGAGWALLSMDERQSRVDARCLDAADVAQRAELFAGLPSPDDDDAAAPFAWAHSALCRHGLRLKIGSATRNDRAAGRTMLVQLRHHPCAAVEAPMLVIDVEAGTNCLLVEHHEREPRRGERGVVQNLQAWVQLGDGATLQHLRIALPARGDSVAHHVHARLGRGARYRQALIATGSGYHLQRSAIELPAEPAEARLGSVLCAAGTALDRQVRVSHAAARTSSVVEGLALAGGNARAVLSAHTRIAPGSDEALARQHLAGIPTGGEPKLVLRPHLEILHHKVQAAHGATWGALPEEALFYARQRGLDEPHARGLIVEGMAAAVLECSLEEAATLKTLAIDDLLARVIARHLDESAQEQGHA